MSPNQRDENYYETLKVDRKATIAQIVAAYHSARNAFSKDSVATYSLFSEEEVKVVLAKLDVAYHTLSNLEKRADYDRMLTLHSENVEIPPTMTELERKQNAQSLPKEAILTPELVATAVTPAGEVATAIPEVDPDLITGSLLKGFRERRGLTVDDVARITKIPAKFIRAIEDDDSKKMPARVYVQGFVKNLASLYRLDPSATIRNYLLHLERISPDLL